MASVRTDVALMDSTLLLALAHIDIARRNVMRAARYADELHNPEAHQTCMLLADACDDATTKFNEYGDIKRMERVAYDIDAENELRAERHQERISLEDQYEQEDLR